MPHSDPDNRRRFDRERKQNRRKAGLCVDCPAKAPPGQSRCDSCRETRNAQRRKHPQGIRLAGLLVGINFSPESPALELQLGESGESVTVWLPDVEWLLGLPVGREVAVVVDGGGTALERPRRRTNRRQNASEKEGGR